MFPYNTHVVAVYQEFGQPDDASRQAVWDAVMVGPHPHRPSCVVRVYYEPPAPPVIEGPQLDDDIQRRLAEVHPANTAAFVCVITKIYDDAAEPLVSNNMCISPLPYYRHVHNFLRRRLMEQLGDGFPWRSYDYPMKFSWRDSENITGTTDPDYLKACMKRVLDDYPEHYEVLKRFGAADQKFSVHISSQLPAAPATPRLPADVTDSTHSPEYIAQVRWGETPHWQPPPANVWYVPPLPFAQSPQLPALSSYGH